MSGLFTFYYLSNHTWNMSESIRQSRYILHKAGPVRPSCCTEFKTPWKQKHWSPQQSPQKHDLSYFIVLVSSFSIQIQHLLLNFISPLYSVQRPQYVVLEQVFLPICGEVPLDSYVIIYIFKSIFPQVSALVIQIFISDLNVGSVSPFTSYPFLYLYGFFSALCL